MKRFLLFLFLCSTTIAIAQDKSGRMALDLPVYGSGRSESDEDLPEAITFYGSVYEGDAFFWTLDKSCSMYGEKLVALKREVNTAINELSSRADFGLVAFSTGYTQWQRIPKRASSVNKTAAHAWVDSLEWGGGTYISAPTIETLRISNMSHKRHVSLIVVSDGMPADAATAISDITSANYKRHKINTLYIMGPADYASAIIFMRNLAAANNGTFRQVT